MDINIFYKEKTMEENNSNIMNSPSNENFKTSNKINNKMEYMFRNCQNITSIDFPYLDISFTLDHKLIFKFWATGIDKHGKRDIIVKESQIKAFLNIPL